MRAFFPSFVLLAAPLLAQAPPPAPSPSPTPAMQFPSEVELVNVDVVVMDKKGNAVTGLTREDFVLKDEGKPQNITSFEALVTPEAPPAGAPTPPPRVSTNAGARDRKGRTFNVVFDDIHMTAAQGIRAKGAVAEFLKTGTRDGDTVTLASTSGAAWWTARMPQGREELMTMLKRLEGRRAPEMGNDRVTDYEAMRIILFGDMQVSERVSRRFETYGVGMSRSSSAGASDTSSLGGDPYVRSRAQEVYFQSVARTNITLQLIERILKSLSTTRGRKSMILVSEGFIYDPSLSGFKEVVEAARRANVAIYFLDTRGLGGLPAYFSAEFGPALDERDVGFAFSENIEASEGSDSLALDSGGFAVSNTNDLAAGIRRIVAESQAYYLLGFNPSDVKRDGKFRKLEVRVNRKDVQVRARKGYYAPADGARKTAKKNDETDDPDIQKALDSPYDSDSIPLRMSAYVQDETLLGKATTVVVAEVDIGTFDFEEKDGRFEDTLEFLLVVAHRETGEFFRYDQKVEMKLLPETRERMRRSWLPLLRDFELQPGGYQAKIVVRDKRSGRIGTVLHEFEVPPLGPLRTSTPVLSDTLAPSPDGSTSHPRPQMLARRDFPQGAMIYCQFDVYGAATDQKNGMPRVSAGYTIRAKGGVDVLRVAPTVITPTSLGKLSRLVGSELKDAQPGDYEFVLSVKDEIGGKALELVEPFTVVPPPPAAD